MVGTGVGGPCDNSLSLSISILLYFQDLVGTEGFGLGLGLDIEHNTEFRTLE